MVVGATWRHAADGMRLGEAAHRTRIRAGVAQWTVVRRAASQLNDTAHHARQVS
jgi:hypothetical protein